MALSYNQRIYNYTYITGSPLLRAVDGNNPELLKSLLLDVEQRETIDIEFLGIHTPLRLAAGYGYIECGEALLKAGARTDLNFGVDDVGELTLSEYARHYGNEDFALMVDQCILERERIAAGSGSTGNLAKACITNLRQKFFSSPRPVFLCEGLPVDLAANKDSLGETVLPVELHRRLGLD